MREETKIRIYQTVVTVVIVLALIVISDIVAQAQQPVTVEGEYPTIWLILDGTAVGTVEPGTFEYDLAANTISVDTRELIYGCQQAVIFRDRYEIKPN